MSPRNRAGRYMANERGAFERTKGLRDVRGVDQTKREPLKPPMKAAPKQAPRWIN